MNATETAINPLDFQVSKEFPPTKESTWPYPAAEDGWFKAHAAIRREVAALQEALVAMQQRGAIQKQWEIEALQEAMKAHFVHIHAHHTNEDDIMAPFLQQRFRYPEKLTTDHDGLIRQLAHLEVLIGTLKVNDSVDEVLQEFTKYEEELMPHLKEEEDIVVPLMRAYFEPQEVQPAILEIIQRSPKLEMGSLIASAGVEVFRNQIMVAEGIPFYVWHIDFYWKYRAFLRQFMCNVQALTSGAEPRKCLRTLL